MHLNIKMPAYQFRDPHVKDKMVSPPYVLSLTWEFPYLGKTSFILRWGPDILHLLSGSISCSCWQASSSCWRISEVEALSWDLDTTTGHSSVTEHLLIISLVPGRCGCNLRLAIFKLISTAMELRLFCINPSKSRIDILSISCEISCM